MKIGIAVVNLKDDMKRKGKKTAFQGQAFYEKLHDFWRLSQRKVNTKWKRTLPFGDYIIDRWEKAKLLGFGEKTSIYDNALVIGNVRVGENTWIGPFTILDGSGLLTIGDNCSISAGVQIYTHDSVKWAVSGGKEQYEYAPTTIGNNCYIGPNTVIAKGVIIGEGCIIGANSFVNRSFPMRTKLAGNPARIIEKIT